MPNHESPPNDSSMPEYSASNDWSTRTTRQRCEIVGRAAATLCAAAEELIGLAQSEQRVDPVETIAAELVPLCDALKFIRKRGPHILRTKRHGLRRRPIWMFGVRSAVYRDPYGEVLILGTWNYPLLLVGTQAAQALAAGNEVILKPAVGSEAVTERMVRAFHDAGVPQRALRQIGSSTESAVATIDAGVDLIVLTGAAATGRKVLAQAAAKLTPAIMELSGCDAVVVMENADLEFTADAIRWALCFNSGATCIGPRRLIVHDDVADALAAGLSERLAESTTMVVHPSARAGVAEILESALQSGAVDLLGVIDTKEIRATGRMKPAVLDHVNPELDVAASDMFAPVTSIIRVKQMQDAVGIVNHCRYRLAASVFGSGSIATDLANQLKVGSLSINDLVMPTSDPRLPFGGRGESGFGVTRGEEGLLAMTTPRVVSRRRGQIALHLSPSKPHDAEALLGALHFMHAGTWRERCRGMIRMMKAPRTWKQMDAEIKSRTTHPD